MSESKHGSFDDFFYPGTQTLINKFDLKDANRLAEIERAITLVTTADAKRNPIAGAFDLSHMQAIHKKIFGEVYPWAGQVRDFGMMKQRIDGLVTEFARPSEIKSLNADLQAIMLETKKFKSIPPNEFAQKIAKVYQIANEMHPFREGNGRTQRVYLDYLANQAGYKLDFSRVEKDAWNYAASMAGQIHLGVSNDRLPGRTKELEKVFERVSVKKETINSYLMGRLGLTKTEKPKPLTLKELNPKVAEEKKAYRR